jgi:hypothetical protein
VEALAKDAGYNDAVQFLTNLDKAEGAKAKADESGIGKEGK